MRELKAAVKAGKTIVTVPAANAGMTFYKGNPWGC